MESSVIKTVQFVNKERKSNEDFFLWFSLFSKVIFWTLLEERRIFFWIETLDYKL